MSIKSLTRDFAFYGLLDLLQRSLAIAMVPVYTRILSQASYGDLDLIFTIISALTVLIDLQLVAGFSRFYLQHHKEGRGPEFVGTSLLARALLGGAIAASVLALGFSGLLEGRYIPSFESNSTAWTLMLLGIPVSLTYEILLLQTQMLRQKKCFFFGAVGNTLLSTLLCIVFTVFAHLGIVGVVLGQFLGKVLATSFLFIGLWREISFRYSCRVFAELMRYTAPLVPGWWLGFSSAYISRFFVYGAQGAAENAILAITTKLASVLGLFIVAFRTAWQPLAMSLIGKDDGEKFYIGSLRLFMAAGILSIFGLTFFAKPLLALLAPDSYRGAAMYVPYFLVGSIIGELEVNLQLGNQISKKTHWMSIGSIIAFMLNLAILTILTVRCGIYAAAMGLLFSFILKVSITYLSAQRNYRIPYDKRAFYLFCTSCFALLALSAGRSMDIIHELAFLGGTAIVGVILPWMTLTRTERDYIKMSVGRYRNQLFVKLNTRLP